MNNSDLLAFHGPGVPVQPVGQEPRLPAFAIVLDNGAEAVP
jgi:hypothetical protein